MRGLILVRNPIGGIRTYLRYVYAAPSMCCHDWEVFAVEHRTIGEVVRELEATKLRTHIVPRKRWFWHLVRLVEKRAREGLRPELIHSQGLSAALAGSVAAAVARVPHVVTLHETIEPRAVSGVRGRVLSTFLGRALGHAAAIVCVTNDARENLVECIPSLARHPMVVAIPTGVDVNAFEVERATRPVEARRPDEPVRFGFLGRLMPEKGLYVLVPAMELLVAQGHTRITLDVFSQGAFVREFKSQVAAKGLEGFVSCRDVVPTVAPVLAAMDAVVMPSLREAAGLLAIETLVSGCPLIASNCIGLREVIRGTPAIVLEPGNPRALAGAMSEFVSRSAHYTGLAAAYVPEARRRFDVAVGAAQLNELLTAVVASVGVS